MAIVHGTNCIGSFYARVVERDEKELDSGGSDESDAPGATLRVLRSLAIPMSEISWRATTSGGPGGQHANRTLSRVEVQFDIANSATLGPRQRARLAERFGSVVRTAASESRSQARNRQVALDRLASKLAEGLRVDPDRRPTKPTKSSQERRMEGKRRRAQTKRQRRTPDDFDS